MSDDAVLATVNEILGAVRARGDAALLEYCRRFDGLEVDAAAQLEMTPARLEQAYREIAIVPMNAMRWSRPPASAPMPNAKTRILGIHRGRRHPARPAGQPARPGRILRAWRQGGYPSSVLMNAIPAAVAGVGELIMVVPTPGGAVNELVLAAAFIAGVRPRVYRSAGRRR